ncbi:MAG: accessory Sec system protein Asp3 [Lachnospiraceae bacterium]|uniref:Accessory Sec system protein Asp3 n=1 Tax=Candidatus Weimeria bifida TaxID=2599074 RepID=A0A6N7IWL7_9FIRM|nr:accessory Sec system protein Asp3 [Candidatus Weimeria bifida]RRF96053.1 MAG: accessory Sec system protein Asp3 [Lachnospiraceae bacterium]
MADKTADQTDQSQEFNNKWKILWNEYASDTYLYGTELRFLSKDDVFFKNLLVPPGTAIKTWHSMVNFQAGRIEPTLPIIDGEGSYHISVDIDCDVPGGAFIRLVYFGKNGDEAGALVVEDSEMDFKCPLKTYSYEAQLICAGAHEIHFHSFTISERTD